MKNYLKHNRTNIILSFMITLLEWIDTERVYDFLLNCGSKILPNPRGSFVFIR